MDDRNLYEESNRGSLASSANACDGADSLNGSSAVERPDRRKRLFPVAIAVAALVSGGTSFGLARLASSSPATSTTSHISVSPTTPTNPGSDFNGSGNPGFGSVGGGYGGGNTGNPGTGNSGTGNSGSQNSTSEATGSPANVGTIAQRVDPGLVDIDTNLSYENEEAAGTGMVLTPNGEVLTNNHVIAGATSISVTDIGNGKTYKANVVGYDATQDVAVLQLVGGSGLSTVTLANSSTVKSGDSVVGIGNAGGAGGTPSYAGGEVTGVNQSITASDSGSGTSENLTGLLATNADIQAGDSGGPLVNASGAVIGMDTAGSSSQGGGFGFSDSTGSTTQGFAIPINTALSIVKKIEAGTTSSLIHIGTTAFLGIQVESASQSNGTGFGGYAGEGYGDVGSSGSSTSGAVIAQAISGEPAANAGLSAGDTITSIDGTTITDPTSLQQALLNLKPGEKVSLSYTSSQGTQQTASVTLASGPPQ